MNNGELSDCSKNLICKELDSAVQSAISDFSAGGTISDESTQSLCNVLEAIFIHGLNDAFFLKGSRYSKYPEPNFWPFVSKFIHKTVRTQIAGLKQIRNEVGRARAWIRVVLNENVLESYVSVLAADKNQLRVFYQKSAFLRDHERVEALLAHLKSISRLRVAAPINSSFLNTWTPTPLIMAGLCGAPRGATLRPTASRRFLTTGGSSASLKSDEGGGGSQDDASQSECLPIGGASSKFHKMDSQSSLFTVGSPQSRGFETLDDDEDDRSSVYSHPSLLDGGISINSLASSRPFNSTLSCTPENAQLPPPDRAFATDKIGDDSSTEVVVRRKKTRIRKVSRQSITDGTRSRSGNNSGEMSRSASQAALSDAAAAAPSTAADSTAPLSASKEPSDSGYKQTTDNDDSKESPPSSSAGECSSRREQFSGEDSALKKMGQAANDNISNESPRPGSSLHDELRALGGPDSFFSSLGLQSSAAIDCNAPAISCSSSFDTDYSLPVGSFSTAIRSAVGKSDLFFNSERKISQCSSTVSGGADAGAAQHDDDVFVLSPTPSTTATPAWCSPTERLIRQLGRRSAGNTTTVNSDGNRAESEPPNAMLRQDKLKLDTRRHSTTPIKATSSGDALTPLVGEAQNRSPTATPLATPTKSVAPTMATPSTILTTNRITGEQVVLQVLTRCAELPYLPLEVERPVIDDDVVVVDHSALMEADEYGISQDLLRVTRIPLERGLDAQEFRCPSCRKSIGGSFGTFKICNLDCKYYCEDCWRRGDESVIPARMIWNWDCRRRPICKASRAFLRSIADRPFIRVDKLNPTLYEHSRAMERKSRLLKLDQDF